MADEGDALVAGGVSQTPSYLSCKSEIEVKKVFQQQLEVFIRKNVDFLIAEVNKDIIKDGTLSTLSTFFSAFGIHEDHVLLGTNHD